MKKVKVLAGKYENAEGPEKGHNVEPIYFHIKLNGDKEFKTSVPSDITHLFICKGELKVGNENHSKTGNSNLILLNRGDILRVVL